MGEQPPVPSGAACKERSSFLQPSSKKPDPSLSSLSVRTSPGETCSTWWFRPQSQPTSMLMTGPPMVWAGKVGHADPEV